MNRPDPRSRRRDEPARRPRPRVVALRAEAHRDRWRSLSIVTLGACALLALLLLRPGASLAQQQATAPADAAVATFAGGCFWCMEPPYDKIEGVFSTTSGYMGGELEDPSYEQVSRGGTGHAEVVQVAYDPEVVDYATLLDVFWKNIDPLTADRQFCDAGSQYRSAIFVHDERQRELAEASKRELAESGRLDGPIVTEINAADTFWPAEEYHQNYYEKNPIRYRFYRASCGRDNRLEEVWGST